MENIERLTIAIQKPDGRLADPSKNLLLDAGLNFRIKPRVDFAYVDGDLPMQIWLRKNASIARAVEQGTEDFGILGLDMIKETGANVLPLLPLGFAKGEVYLGVRNDIPYSRVQDLKDKKVVTFYTAIATGYFNNVNVRVNLIYEDGGEESLVNSGRADACIVFSETGDTGELNNIIARESLLTSEAYLTASPTLREKRGSERLVEQFLIRILSVLRGREFTMMEMNCPEEALQRVIDILPSGQSPTVAKLFESGWVSIVSLVPRKRFWELGLTLREVGVQDIVERVISRVVPNQGDRVIMEMMEKIYD